jgi:conjugal transfer pilin signal peptidase TrbI
MSQHVKTLSAQACTTWKKPNRLVVISLLLVILVFGTLLLLHRSYEYSVNLSQSLPETFFIIEKQKPYHLNRGEYIGFAWRGGWGYPKHMTFVKQVAGVAGDRVYLHSRFLYVNGELIGYVKPKSKGGIPLHPLNTAVIPKGKLFVRATHMDSFDSRYEEFGLVDEQQIIGRAYGFL